MELLRLQAEKLAVARRESRLQAQEWTRDIKMESDDEKERKPKKPRKVKTEGVSGDEGEQQPPKKKRRGKLKKNAESGDDKDGALFTDEEGIDEKPAKKVIRISPLRRAFAEEPQIACVKETGGTG